MSVKLSMQGAHRVLDSVDRLDDPDISFYGVPEFIKDYEILKGHLTESEPLTAGDGALCILIAQGKLRQSVIETLIGTYRGFELIRANPAKQVS